MDSRFPDKLFYRIGDVSKSLIKPHILRYWEAELVSYIPARMTRASGSMNGAMLS
jgi:hypothetical protein